MLQPVVRRRLSVSDQFNHLVSQSLKHGRIAGCAAAPPTEWRPSSELALTMRESQTIR